VTARPKIAPLQQEMFTWTFPGGPLRINLPLRLIARLQTEIDKHHRQHADTSRVEMGGVLLGREGTFPDTLEIEDYICLPSATADGRFDWSNTVSKQIVSPGEQTRSVGYFRTEWGDTLRLRDEELDSVQKQLSDRTNVVLLIQSSPEARKAGFLFSDGDELTPISFMDFPFDAEVLKQEASQRSVSPPDWTEESEVAPETTLEPMPQKMDRSPPMHLSTKRLWMLCAAMFGLGAGWGIFSIHYLLPSFGWIGQSSGPTDSVKLGVKQQPNGINGQWNFESKAVGKAHDGRSKVPAHWASAKFTAPSWISACIDGRMLAGKILPAGSEVEIEFFWQAQLVVGNAGGVQMALEGKPLGPLGPQGESRLVKLTPSRFSVLASGTVDSCRKH
jgi:hypothetical protein